MYTSDEISGQKELRRHARIAMAAVSGAAVLVCAVLLIAVRPVNDTLFRVIATAAVVLAGCFDIYMASYVLPYMRPRPKKRSLPGRAGHVAGNILRQLHMYIIWGIVAGIFVSFLFNLRTDTVPLKKVTVWVDVADVQSEYFETELDRHLPEGIKLVKVHSTSYSLFGLEQIGSDDIYILPEDSAEAYLQGFAPLSEFAEIGDDLFYKDNDAYGILVCSADGERCAAGKYIEYRQGRNYYLFFGKDSLHKGPAGAAVQIARDLLGLE